jgi:hypothetical protein
MLAERSNQANVGPWPYGLREETDVEKVADRNVWNVDCFERGLCSGNASSHNHVASCTSDSQQWWRKLVMDHHPPGHRCSRHLVLHKGSLEGDDCQYDRNHYWDHDQPNERIRQR